MNPGCNCPRTNITESGLSLLFYAFQKWKVQVQKCHCEKTTLDSSAIFAVIVGLRNLYKIHLESRFYLLPFKSYKWCLTFYGRKMLFSV